MEGLYLVALCGTAATTAAVGTTAAAAATATKAVTLTAAEVAALASFAKTGNLGAAILLSKPVALCSASELIARAALLAVLKA